MTDKEILYPLASEYAEIAALPVHKETSDNWGRLNALKSARPTIIIDQIPWGEMNDDGSLTCLCQDKFARSLEWTLRTELYKWKRFRADMVIKPFIRIGKAVSDSGVGLGTVIGDEPGHSGAQTHVYADQLPAIYKSDGTYDEEASLSKLHYHEIKAYPDADKRNLEQAEELLSGLIPVRLAGVGFWHALWDRITFWRGAETALYSLYDEPEHVHALMARLVAIENDYVDKLEAAGALDGGEGVICHCMETYTDEQRWYDIDPDHIRPRDMWVSGAAQIFSEVSPAMHDEFEIEFMKPLYERFGWVNYGCCEPLHNKIDIIRKIKTVRAISVSPWADVDAAADAMGSDYLMARKPNPSYVRDRYPDVDSVRAEIRRTLDACRRNGTNVEFILKDITTVGGRPQCLTEWYDLVKAEIENY